MCGIFGFDEVTPNTRRMAPILAKAMELRGRMSWGGTNNIEVVKCKGLITDNFDIPEHWESAIFHTRHATHGTVTVNNTHPHIAGSVLGIHNGVISNHEELNEAFGRNFAVDSQHIFAHLDEERDMGDLYGYGAIAYYQNNALHFGKSNTSDLHIIQLSSGEIVFCSTWSALMEAARAAKVDVEYDYTLESDIIYQIKDKELIVQREFAITGGNSVRDWRSYGSSTSSNITRTAIASGFLSDDEEDEIESRILTIPPSNITHCKPKPKLGVELGVLTDDELWCAYSTYKLGTFAPTKFCAFSKVRAGCREQIPLNRVFCTACIESFSREIEQERRKEITYERQTTRLEESAEDLTKSASSRSLVEFASFVKG